MAYLFHLHDSVEEWHGLVLNFNALQENMITTGVILRRISFSDAEPVHATVIIIPASC